MFKKYKFKDFRFRLVIYVIALTILGIMVIGSANASVQNKQIVGMIGGTIIMLVLSVIDYNWILKFSWLIYGFMVVILGLVLTGVGDSSGGAQRWVEFGSLRFQPSELAKILLILFFAYFFSKHEENLNTLKVIICSLILAGIPLLLIKMQPDLSTTIVAAIIFCGMLFIAGLSYKLVGAVLATIIPLSVVAISLILTKGSSFLDEYQYLRIMAWLKPEEYAQSALQQQNSIMAIGSGQIWGKGLNNNVVASMKNGNFISEPETDFIFAIVGEELGFVGCAIVILLLFLIVFECIFIAKRANNLAGKLIASGMATLIAFQGFVNICVATGLMPNTGLTLPFVSYGLTSLLSLYIGVGFVLNVGLQPKKYRTGVYK